MAKEQSWCSIKAARGSAARSLHSELQLTGTQHQQSYLPVMHCEVCAALPRAELYSTDGAHTCKNAEIPHALLPALSVSHFLAALGKYRTRK